LAYTQAIGFTKSDTEISIFWNSTYYNETTSLM
jgi:hypothetical protein